MGSPRFMYPYHLSKYGWSETIFWNNHNWVDLLSSCGLMPSLRFLYHRVNMEEVKGKCLLFSWLSYEWIWECGWPRKMFQYFLNIPHYIQYSKRAIEEGLWGPIWEFGKSLINLPTDGSTSAAVVLGSLLYSREIMTTFAFSSVSIFSILCAIFI